MSAPPPISQGYPQIALTGKEHSARLRDKPAATRSNPEVAPDRLPIISALQASIPN
jgi:hypothetical protein